MSDSGSTYDELAPLNLFTVVGIGGSAGGLEAIQQMLEKLDSRTGMAFVYVQHLDPFKPSRLSEILQWSTSMKVIEVTDGQTLEQNCVFVIPPNKDLTLTDKGLKLTPRAPKPARNLPIDLFLESLAEIQKENSIGIILSGNASDGAYGLKCLKLAGGITMVQDSSAKFDSMPAAAIAEGDVDMVLSPFQMAEELGRIGSHPKIGAEYENPESAVMAESNADYDFSLAEIIRRLTIDTGVDFLQYKLSTIRRRINRRLLICRFDGLQEYLSYIISNPGELKILYQDVLIHVTSFFRDPDTVELVKKTIFPQLRGVKKIGAGIRVWIVGCASGEEAYSLAILMREVYGPKQENFKIQIFATDLSDRCVLKARMGIYTPSEVSRVSEQRLQKYFEPVDDRFRINKDIRDLCIFSAHNVLRDPPFSRMDIISCCNLMIYLNFALQKKILSVLHYALNPTGTLILGKSESVYAAPALFSQPDKKAKIFQRSQNLSAKENLKLLFSMQSTIPVQNNRVSSKMPPTISINSMENQVDDLLLKKYIPPCVVVNSGLDIIQFRGPASIFFEPSQGKASLNVLRMVKPSLAFEIQHLVGKSLKSGELATNNDLLLKMESSTYKVILNVNPVQLGLSDEKLFCVTIQEILTIPDKTNLSDASPLQVVQDMQRQLERAQQEMHSIIEGKDASVEELQSANEEITSSNEELQTINEELETSKEEVESANEELQSINKELQISNRHLSESYEYSEAVFETISEAVLILTPDFRVKLANTAFYSIFKTGKSETEGSLLFDLGTGQWDLFLLRKQLKAVLSGAKPIENFEIDKFFPGAGQKLLLLNARRIKGNDSTFLVLLAIKDVSEHRRAQQLIIRQEELFRNMANNIPVMIWTLDVSESCNFMNRARLNFTGRSLESEMGTGWMDDIHAEELADTKSIYSRSFKSRIPFVAEYRLRKYDSTYRWVSGAGNPNYSQDGSFIGFVIYCLDIHDRKLALKEIENQVEERTEQLKVAMSQLMRSNDELSQFAYAASHDLQEPVRKILLFAEKLKRAAPVLGVDTDDYLAKIQASAERMRTLIRDLLNLTKLSESERTAEPVDLNSLVGVVLKDFDLLMSEKNVKLELGHLPTVKGLPVQLHQLFHNLISNALKFSVPGKEGLIRIRQESLGTEDEKLVSALGEKESYVKLSVQDKGIGFGQEFAEDIFTIFKRLNGNKELFPGSGIGLALCKKIIINHRGAIYATSELANGSCFSFLLPEALN